LRARNGSEATAEPVTLTTETGATLRLRADGFGAVEGTVVLPGGVPAEGVLVTLFESTGEMGIGKARVLTDAQGRYRFGSLWPDREYSTHPTLPNYQGGISKRSAVGAGQRKVIPPLQLTPATGVVAGRVVDEKGAPLAGVEVASMDGEGTAGVTDGGGHFLLKGLPSARDAVPLVARMSHDWQEHKMARVGEDDVVIVLKARPSEPARTLATEPEIVGEPAPPLAATAWSDGKALPLQGLKGKVVVVDFWGMSCGPCVGALPAVERLWKQYKAKGVVVIGLHDSGEKIADVVKFARSKGVTYPVAVDAPEATQGWFGQSFKRYGVVGIPSVAVIDPEGKVVYLGHGVDKAFVKVGQLLAAQGR
jgi:thiol-disulfide isomerase/thioredoxin